MNNDGVIVRAEFAAKSMSLLMLCCSLISDASDFRRGSERHVLNNFRFVFGIVPVNASSYDMILFSLKDLNSSVPVLSMSLVLLTTSGGMMSD